MKRSARKAFNALQKLSAPVMEPKEGDSFRAHFYLSGEDNSDEIWADYWEATALERVNPDTNKIEWAFGINTKVHDILNEQGLFAEWINPGLVGIYTI